MFVFDIIGYEESETFGDEEVKEAIRFQSIVNVSTSAFVYLFTQNEMRPGIRWVMYSSNPPFKVSLQAHGGHSEVGKFLDKFIYYIQPSTSSLFFQPAHICELKPWLMQKVGSRHCWIYSVLNGLITSEYFAPIIQSMVDSRDNSHGGGLGCLWLPSKNKEVARKAILDAFVNARGQESDALGVVISEPEIKTLIRETRGKVSAETDAPGIAQNYITMALDFLDIKYITFTLSQTYCHDIEHDDGEISEDVIIVKAPNNFISYRNFLQYKFEGNICERLESKGFVLDHCVMRSTSRFKFTEAHYVTGMKVCEHYFIIDPKANFLVPCDWTNLDNLPTPGFSTALDLLTERAYAYLVYVRKPPLAGGAKTALGSREPPELGNSRGIKPNIDQEGGNAGSPTLYIALLASFSVMVISSFVGSMM